MHPDGLLCFSGLVEQWSTTALVVSATVDYRLSAVVNATSGLERYRMWKQSRGNVNKNHLLKKKTFVNSELESIVQKHLQPT